MYLAIGVDPTKLTALIFWFVNIASTTSLSPFTTLKHPQEDQLHEEVQLISSDMKDLFLMVLI